MFALLDPQIRQILIDASLVLAPVYMAISIIDCIRWWNGSE